MAIRRMQPAKSPRQAPRPKIATAIAASMTVSSRQLHTAQRCILFIPYRMVPDRSVPMTLLPRVHRPSERTAEQPNGQSRQRFFSARFRATSDSRILSLSALFSISAIETIASALCMANCKFVSVSWHSRSC